MKEYFSAYPVEDFILFSPSHLFVLLLIGIVFTTLYLYRDTLRERTYRDPIRLALALLLLVSEAILQGWYLSTGAWSPQRSLPLHLCSVAILLCPIMLITKKKSLYEVLYFWGIGGTAQAILTPDLWYGFPHIIFFQYFIAHTLIVFSCLWMTFVERFRPNLGSIGKAFIITNIYAAFVYIINRILGSNYLYIMSKPDKPTILDFLLPWPWYIVQFEIIVLLVCFLCYLPFFVMDRIKS